MKTIPILPATPFLFEAAHQIAAAFQLSVIHQLPPTLSWFLYLTEQRLELHDLTTAVGPIYVDFVNGPLGYRRCHGGGRKQPLARAIGLKPQINPTVLDTTAGLGRDAFVLAYLGCQVQMVERVPAIAALLQDGLQRAQQNAQLRSIITERLQLIHHDAQDWISKTATAAKYDTIYLDPMYPARQKSALVKKEMRLFQNLIEADLDATALLKRALINAHQRVVVKRPTWAPPLSDSQPTFCIKGQNTRFDVYINLNLI